MPPTPVSCSSVLALLALAGCVAPYEPAPSDGAPSERAAPAAPPNVLVILTDDQGWADVGYHNEAAYTPNLDALAASGVRFEQAYAMPQCTPSRVAAMTGRYPSRFGGAALQASNAPAFPAGTPTLASSLAARGYETYLCGKWHLGSTAEHGPGQFGFEHSYGSLAGAVGMYDHRYREGPFGETWHRDHERIDGFENGEHATDLVTRDAVEFIERERARPFFLYLAYHAVHTPLDERGPFVDRPTQLDPADPTRWLDEDRIPWFHDPLGKIQAEADPERRLFLAALHHLDHSIGEVVAALERSGQRGRTLILFSSDNGPQGSWGGNAYPDDLKLTDFNQPSPWRGKKLDVYEGGIRVPGFASWPGTIKPGTLDAPVHLVDWFPTLNALVGAPPPPVALDGMDLSPTLLDGAALPQRSLYWTWNQRTNRWALRLGRWKLVRYGKTAPAQASDWQLFDLVTDPAEQEDLGERLPERREALHREYLRQRELDRADP